MDEINRTHLDDVSLIKNTVVEANFAETIVDFVAKNVVGEDDYV